MAILGLRKSASVLADAALGAGAGAGLGFAGSSLAGADPILPLVVGGVGGAGLGALHGLGTANDAAAARQAKLQDDRAKRDEALADDMVKRQRGVSETFLTKYVMPRLAEQQGLVPPKAVKAAAVGRLLRLVKSADALDPVRGAAVGVFGGTSPYLSSGFRRAEADLDAAYHAGDGPFQTQLNRYDADPAVQETLRNARRHDAGLYSRPEYAWDWAKDKTGLGDSGLAAAGLLGLGAAGYGVYRATRPRKGPAGAVKSAGPYEGVDQHAHYSHMPVGKKRDLTPEEEALVAQGQSRWLPKLFPSYATPPHELMASPLKSGLIGTIPGGLVGAGLGGVGGAVLGGILGKATGHDQALSAGLGAGAGAAGLGLLGAGLGGVTAGLSRRAENENILDMMKRLPPGATNRDLMSDPAYQTDLDRAHSARNTETLGNSLVLASLLRD